MKMFWLWLLEAMKNGVARVGGVTDRAILYLRETVWPRLQKSAPEVLLQKLEGLRKLLARWTDNMGTSGITVAEAGRLGEVSRASSYLLYGIAFVICSMMMWAYFSQVETVSRSMGKVIPSGKLQVVQNLEGGIVQSIHVQPGQRVEEGQLLVSLSETHFESDLQTRKQQASALAARLVRLKAESEGSPLRFPEALKKEATEYVRTETAAYDGRRIQFNAQVDMLQAQIEQKTQEMQEVRIALMTAEKTLELGRQEHAILSKMVARGLEPKLELIRLERTLADSEGRAETAKATVGKLRAAINEAQARKASVVGQFRSDAQADSNKSLAEFRSLQESLPALQDKKGRTEIRSPVGGVVNRVLVSTVGGVVKPGEPIAEVVPGDDKLVFEAMVLPSDIGFVKVGQSARIKITAYDFSIFGAMTGEVTRMAADATSNEKGESFYIARIETTSPVLESRGSKLSVLPGMQAQVDIVTGYKTIWDYLLKPVLAVRENAFKER
jgi:adhesin transport system membrane fusion protein